VEPGKNDEKGSGYELLRNVSNRKETENEETQCEPEINVCERRKCWRRKRRAESLICSKRLGVE
jgi:hypothetical protein